MLLAIDASRAAGEEKTGVGWYTHHLLAHLKEVIPQEVRVVLYSDRPLPQELQPWPDAWEERLIKRRGLFWSQIQLASVVLRDEPDVFFVPAHVIPWALTRTPSGKRPRLATTIHDVVFRSFPTSYALRERWYADHATKLAVRYADRVIVPTHEVGGALERWYGCDPEKVSVIHHGVQGSAQGTVHTNHEISSSAPNTSQLILYVGRLERKKNVARMIAAFNRIARDWPNARLVLAGSPGYGYSEVHTALDRSPVRGRIETPGWVNRATYQQLLARASVFLFPTLAEGFGLPILEAMSAGVPVITTRGGAHEEVAGHAALLVDAFDVEAIAAGIDACLRDDGISVSLAEHGRERARKFSWEQAARQTWRALEGVLSP